MAQKRQTVIPYFFVIYENGYVVMLHRVAHHMNIKLIKSNENRVCFEHKNQTFFFRDPSSILRHRWSWCCSYFVWFCGFYYEAFHVASCLALCSRVFFSIVITSLGEERAGVCGFRAFVCLFFAHVFFCPLSLPLCVRG